MDKEIKNKNLLIISQGYPCGDVNLSSFVKAQVDQLVPFFSKIYIISPTPYFPAFLGKLKIFRTLFQDFSKVRNYSYHNVDVFYPKYFTLPLGFLRRRNGKFAAQAAQRCIIKNNLNFTLIHAHFIWPSGYVAAKLKERYGTKIVITGHGFDVYSLPFKNSFWRQITLSILKKADGLITVSESNLNHIRKLGFDGEVEVIPNGVSLENFYPVDKKKAREALGLPNDKKIVLAVGNLVTVKNHKTLINAVFELHKKEKDVLLYIIGKGDLEKKLKLQINQLNASEYIKLIGAKPHNELSLWMNAADVFALPSYSESFGIVSIEALACGCPVVSTRNGGAEEIVVSDDYGYLAESPDDANEMCNLLFSALRKEWKVDRMINFVKKYDWTRITERLLGVYSQISKQPESIDSL